MQNPEPHRRRRLILVKRNIIKLFSLILLYNDNTGENGRSAPQTSSRAAGGNLKQTCMAAPSKALRRRVAMRARGIRVRYMHKMVRMALLGTVNLAGMVGRSARL